jgi:exopolyphosphatase/pppGpp-phosphohydrolase
VNILYRRLKRDGDLKYIEKIMDPVIYQSKKYEPVHKSRADIIIDGNASTEKVIEEFKRLVFGGRNHEVVYSCRDGVR